MFLLIAIGHFRDGKQI